MSNARKLADNLPREGQLGNRNIIINGAMQVAQRGTSFTTVADGTFTTDRFNYRKGNDGEVTITQDSSGPDGFANSLKVDVTTADTSIAAGQYSIIEYNVEAQDLQRLAFGTSGAKNFTLSFYVKSNKTGTYAVNISQTDNSSKQATLTYTIDSANTWERKSLTFTGDTSGVINDDNGIGFLMYWWLAAGSTYNSGSTSATFQTYANANHAAGQAVNFLDSTSNEWFITGVQLEVGDEATSFEHEPFEATLRKCQRYYSQINGPVHGYAMWTYSTVCSTHFYLPQEMRTIPSVTFTGTTNQGNSNSVTDNSFSIYNHNQWIGASSSNGIVFGGTNSPNHKTIRVNAYPHGSFTSSGISAGFYMGTNCSINADAEL